MRLMELLLPNGWLVIIMTKTHNTYARRVARPDGPDIEVY